MSTHHLSNSSNEKNAYSRSFERTLKSVLSLTDFEVLARKKLPLPIFAYVSGAVEDNVSLEKNRSSYSEIELIPRVLAGVANRNTSVSLFGQTYATPVGVAPMGITALSAYRGDIVLAQGAAQESAVAIMSGSSLIRLEEVMAAAPGTWFQAYLPGDEGEIVRLLDRIAAALVETLVITVDTPVAANRENNVRAGFSTPLRPNLGLAWQGMTHPRWLLGTLAKTMLRHGMPHFENSYAHRGSPVFSASVTRDFSDRAHFTWAHLGLIRKRWKGPLVVKGILSPRDAVQAKQVGVDGIIVSNHGGRQLDSALAPIKALAAILNVTGAMPVMIDSGIRRGTDVVKALSLGAKYAFVGRPFNYAASVASTAGVAHGIRLLTSEISRDMAMLGVTSIGGLSKECIHLPTHWA